MIDLATIEGFDWDAGNATKNDKHAVSASETEQVFFNQPLIVLADATHSQSEPRFHALGHTDAGRLLQISFTLRRDGTLIRVISARDMHKKERVVYDKADH